MAGPIMGSAANERLNNKKTEVTFAFAITGANPPAAFAVVAPTVGGEAGLVLASGAGTILPTLTFALTPTGANPVIGVEFKDATIAASALLLEAEGVVYATNAANNADTGCVVYAGPSDLLGVVAGSGMGFNIHLGQSAIGNSRIDQASAALGIKFTLTVRYLSA